MPGGYFTSDQVDLWGLDGFWGLPHYPKVPYYQLDERVVSPTATLFEFVVPMYPPTWLDATTVESYAARADAVAVPTAVSLSPLDVKQPADWPEDQVVNTHWCLARYLLDGHHKLHAAAIAGRRARLLSFLAVDQGVSSPEHLDVLFGLL